MITRTYKNGRIKYKGNYYTLIKGSVKDGAKVDLFNITCTCEICFNWFQANKYKLVVLASFASDSSKNIFVSKQLYLEARVMGVTLPKLTKKQLEKLKKCKMEAKCT